MVKNQSDNKVEVFHGFWKYFGVFGSFIVGVVLFWYGSNILIYDYAKLYSELGIIGFLSLAPLIFGAALAWLSFSKFLEIIKI